MLGLSRVRTCVVVLLLCENNEKPEELVITALIRGRHCQLLGEAQGSDDPQRYFMVGLLSVLDAFLDRLDMAEHHGDAGAHADLVGFAQAVRAGRLLSADNDGSLPTLGQRGEAGRVSCA